MRDQSPIPRHPLTDRQGKPADFHFSPWGEVVNSYDIGKTHRHQFYEILFFHKGGGHHDIDFKTYEAKKGSIHFVAPENVHLLLRGKTSEGCSLLFDTSFLDADLLRDLPFNSENPVLNTDPKTYKVIRSLIDEIENEYICREKGYREINQSQLHILGRWLVRQFQREQPGSGKQD